MSAVLDIRNRALVNVPGQTFPPRPATPAPVIASDEEAILEKAGRLIDVALAGTDEGAVAAAALVTAETKALTMNAAILATDKQFELAATRSTLVAYGLDRRRRNAQPHALHAPVRLKYFHIGNIHLNGVYPVRQPRNLAGFPIASLRRRDP